MLSNKDAKLVFDNENYEGEYRNIHLETVALVNVMRGKKSSAESVNAVVIETFEGQGMYQKMK